MGIKERLKDIYYAGEEKWYRFWDKIDTKIPVYKVIDKVDAVVPSFALFLVLLVILVIVGVYALIGSGLFASHTAVFVVNNPDNTLAVGETVNITLENGQMLSLVTDEEGQIVVPGVPLEMEIEVDINSSKGTFSDSFFMEEDFYEIITLTSPWIFAPKTRTIILQNELGVRIQEPVELLFYCENSGVTPTPASIITTNGVAEVTEPDNCGTLYAKPISDNYESTVYVIDSTNNPIMLIPYEPPKNKATVRVRDGTALVTDTSFRVSLQGRESYEQRTGSSSQAILDVVPGNYFVSVSDPSGNYGIATSQIDTTDGSGEITVTVSKTVKAVITVNVTDDYSGAIIEDAEVALYNASGMELSREKTDDSGKVSFSVVDTGDFTVSAKKVGEVGAGYFAEIIELENVTSDITIDIGLELITTENAGRVKVTVKDQDDETVQNAKIMLKYVANDSIVELNETKNYVITDLNGEIEFLAGKVDGWIVAYATKYPFSGTSAKGTIDLDQLNEFDVMMQIGSTTVNLSVTDEDGESIDAVAEIFNATGDSLTGLISVESGSASRSIKAGRTIFAVVTAEGYENYVTAPIQLWPDQAEFIDIDMKVEINEPAIELLGLYTEDGRITQGMNAGEKYYAKLLISSDDDYSDTEMHFRVGQATHLSNDYMEIDRVEAANVSREVRGISYDPVLGYEYDSENFTEGDAKWVTVGWDDFGTGSREVTVHFKVKAETPPNSELQFFWRALFDDTRVPESTEDDIFYSDVYHSKIYFEGSDTDCEEEFCFSSDWLYSQSEELYINPPYYLNQIEGYTYHFQIVNNSSFNYTAAQKPIYMYVEVIGNNNDEKMLRINEYSVSDNLGEVVGGEGYIVDRIELNSFERQTAVDVELELEGIKDGGEVIRVRMQSEGVEIYTTDISFTVLAEEEFNVQFEPTSVPALVNTEITVAVTDEDGEPVPDVRLRLFMKEPGYADLVVDEIETSRLGTATLNSGSFFSGTKLYVEVEKIGFARAIYELSVVDTVVGYTPGTIVISMNTVSDRDVTESVEITNLISHDLGLFDIILDSAFDGLINETAFISYFSQFEGEEILAMDSVEFELFRAQLSNDATPQAIPDGYTVEGVVTIGFRPSGSNIIYDSELPLRINISSNTEMEAAGCMAVTNATQTDVTQTGRVTFNFELTNACQADGVDIGLDSISASTTSTFGGQAEITLQSMTTTRSGRSALDSSERALVTDVEENEIFAGTVTYVPSQTETGDTITLNVEISGMYGDQEIDTVPGNLQLTVDVINLRECIEIDSDASPVAFDSESTITIDATGCGGQDIDIQLCKGDAKCSGGTAEGGITLSTKSFTLTGESKTVTAYSPSMAGTYGVTVHAREEGTGSFTYIGEAVVGFEQADSKRFELNKTDFTLVGDGAQDSAILTNTFLIETVTVGAEGCIWGTESVDFDWAGALSGAMMGAAIGSTIGGAFGSDSTKAKDTANEKDETKASEATDPQSTPQLADGEDVAISVGTDGATTINQDTGWSDISGGEQVMNLDSEGGLNPLTTEQFNNATGGELDGMTLNSTGSYGNAIVTSQNGTEYYVVSANRSDGLAYNNETLTLVPVSNTTSSGYGSVSINSDATYYTMDATIMNNEAISVTTPPITPPVYTNTTTPPSGYTTVTSGNTTTYTHSQSGQQISIVNTGNTQAIEILPPPTPVTQTPIEEYFKYPVFEFAAKETVEKLSFVSKQTAAGWGGLIGAIAGALIMGFDGAVDCSDSEYDDTADCTDFITFLQGDSLDVLNTTTGLNETKTIPSDAGSLSVEMANTDGSVSASWDFEDADYSTEENVGITFTNSGMNDAEAKYGVFTVTATEHIHGDLTHSNSDTEYDVWCQNGNFANYWIGGETDSGLCSNISDRTYSQQYHLRVTSGEPQDNSPYTRKSSSCYVGTLAGSTGADAMPKILLDWDWDSIEYDSCDYGNDDYIYCDATQFSIAMVKRLGMLKDFLERNPGLECPPNQVIESIDDELSRYESSVELVADGFIGVTDINVLVNHVSDTTDVTINVDNKTSGNMEVNMCYTLSGETSTDPECPLLTFGVGESAYLIEGASTPEWDGVYMFTATINTENADSPGYANRRAVTKAFLNVESGEDDCWAETTTETQSGLPAIYYYVDQTDDIDWSGDIQGTSDLLDLITYRSYLMKDNYSDDFKADFKRYYQTTFLQSLTDDEKDVLDHFTEFDIVKKYTSDSELTAGLYYISLEVDMDEDMLMFEEDGSTTVNAEVLLIKNPSTSFPFYSIPFDGELGFDDGRESYGVSYNNEDEEITLNDQTLVHMKTFEAPIENGLVTLTTEVNNDLATMTAGLSSRGQLMSVSTSGDSANLDFTPNYATPVMAKIGGNSGTDVLFAYQMESAGIPQNTGGNLSYWTGAAQSYDFYGALAADLYYDSADYQLDESSGITEPGVTYGFSWDDITNDSTLYMKTIMYTPTDKKVILKSDNDETQIWNPNQTFSTTSELTGISGMPYNDYARADSIRTVQNLLDLVEDGKVCITNDGTSMKFWWNPRIVSITPGSTGESLEGAEVNLIGN